MLSALLAGATLGAFSLPHCAAMCGPLSSAVCARASGTSPALRYQAGRVAGYALMGSLFGELGGSLRFLAPTLSSAFALHVFAAAAAIVVAAQLLRAPQADTRLIALGHGPRTTPMRSRAWTQLARLVPREPMVLGGLSALLPCGALAAGLLAAAATTTGAHGAALMVGFAVSSGPALWLADRVLAVLRRHSKPTLRRVAAVALIVLALLLVAKPLRAVVSADPSTSPAVHCH